MEKRRGEEEEEEGPRPGASCGRDAAGGKKAGRMDEEALVVELGMASFGDLVLVALPWLECSARNYLMQPVLDCSSRN